MNLRVPTLLAAMVCLGCEAPSTAPGGAFQTSAVGQLRRDIVANVMMFHRIKFPGCDEAKPTAARVLAAKGTRGDSVITEEWTVAGCGKAYLYTVQLFSSPRGGTDIAIQLGPDNPRVIPG